MPGTKFVVDMRVIHFAESVPISTEVLGYLYERHMEQFPGSPVVLLLAGYGDQNDSVISESADQVPEDEGSAAESVREGVSEPSGTGEEEDGSLVVAEEPGTTSESGADSGTSADDDRKDRRKARKSRAKKKGGKRSR